MAISSAMNLSGFRTSLLRVVVFSFVAAGAVALVCSLPSRTTRRVEAAAPDAVQTGATLFHEKGCEHCHGADGRGTDLGPDLSTIGKRWKNPQIATQIHDGGAGMPAFGEALQPDEITALVAYLHTKRKAPKGTKSAPAAVPPAAAADPSGN
jgi:mono/diheme cytochrome c family protein